MTADGLDSKHRFVQVGFFLYGALVHYPLARIYAHLSFLGKEEKGLVAHLPVQVVAALVGGVIASVVFPKLLRRAYSHGKMSFFRCLLRGGLAGVFTTELVLLVYYCAYSGVISLEESRLAAPFAYPYVLMGVVTYGMDVVVSAIPLSFVYGVLGALASLPLLARTYGTKG